MNNQEIPEIYLCNYANQTYGGSNLLATSGDFQQGTAVAEFRSQLSDLQKRQVVDKTLREFKSQVQQQETNAMSKRIIKVFIADPDVKVPAEASLLYSGEEKFTDLNDQELFFEIEMKKILTDHNEKRVKILDKEATAKSGRDVFLEPIKLRDLRMTVVKIAEF